MMQFMGLQRVGHNLAAEQQQSLYALQTVSSHCILKSPSSVHLQKNLISDFLLLIRTLVLVS